MDIDLDISDDMECFDGKTALHLSRRGQQIVSLAAGTSQEVPGEWDIPGCLINAVAQREIGAVRQTFQRGMSIQQDILKQLDTTIDVPQGEWGDIRVNDTLVDLDTGRTWMVLAVDLQTLSTRWHCACQSVT